MGSYSSKSKTPPEAPMAKPKIVITDRDRAMLDLKNARDRLQRYRTKLLLDDEKLIEKAKRAKAAKQTTVALNLMRLHQYKQQQYENCNTQLLNILQMVETIDSKQNDLAVIQAMKAGKQTLQQMHEEISIDSLLQLMDEIQEQHETEQEISDILQQNIPQLANLIDEAAVEAELEALQASMMVDTLPEAPTEALLPEAPSHALPTAESAQAASSPVKEPERVLVSG
jgi:charged multivesicular body protein 6